MTRLEFRARAARRLEDYAPAGVIAAVLDDADEYAARMVEEHARKPLPRHLTWKTANRTDEKAAGL